MDDNNSNTSQETYSQKKRVGHHIINHPSFGIENKNVAKMRLNYFTTATGDNTTDNGLS